MVKSNIPESEVKNKTRAIEKILKRKYGSKVEDIKILPFHNLGASRNVYSVSIDLDESVETFLYRRGTDIFVVKAYNSAANQIIIYNCGLAYVEFGSFVNLADSWHLSKYPFFVYAMSEQVVHWNRYKITIHNKHFYPDSFWDAFIFL
jgi:hypothetical protein